ncbi:MAG: hypothetical protein FJ137_07715 [Deltaproteobacteria bacterium]|nr:hypothetical protein [Deltaproteobacteria bacterium]
MSRVDHEPPPSAQEAERAAKEADKRSRDAKLQEQDRQAFGKLLQGQKQAKDGARSAEKKQGEARAGEQKATSQTKGQEQADRAARMARGGALQHGRVMEQAKGFQGALESTQQRTQVGDQGRVQARDTGKQKDRVEHDDRKEAVTQKAQAKQDREADLAAVERRESARPNAAIDTSDRGGGGGGQPQDDGSAAAAALKAQKQLPDVKATAAAASVKQIPPELLEKLVSTVYLAVTEKGLKEFQIELKDGPLKGAFLKISADNGKVALKFSGVDAHTKNLIESSKGDLMRRLGKKGLTLARLDVA